jgi:hypothetical protein
MVDRVVLQMEMVEKVWWGRRRLGLRFRGRGKGLW